MPGRGIVEEDDLDRRWEEATEERVNEVIFLSKHTTVSNRPALTVHPIGILHLRESEAGPQGGKPGWAAPPSPSIGPWLRHLKKFAQAHNLVPEFEITLEGTHHRPVTNTPTMFVEIGLGLGGGAAVGNWNGEKDKNKVLLGLGGGHYAPRHMDIVLKDGVWVGHLLSGYSMPMEDPNQSKAGTNAKDTKDIGGTWKHAIKAAFEATRSAFPGGEVTAHLDQKSFKSWQKNAITAFLGKQNIKIGKPNDFY
ncbi:hypothetical protein C1H46_041874 [Malus baccata]|uniref:D-aminoacyl-tRNA deacylase n=1 Tax=Malus baccata TaxID=106549 RepID=A0A540KED9_MALBA|nr:hypothetical protein C1H46_041874 [Malus baccata]